MDKFHEDLAATREGLVEVRDELSRRPTRFQFNFTIIMLTLGFAAVAVASILAIRSVVEAQNTNESIEAIEQGFQVSSCRSDLNSTLVGKRSIDLDIAREARASLIERRDNLTISALEAFATGDEAGLEEAVAQASEAREAVAEADALVVERVTALGEGRREYNEYVDSSIEDPEAFARECRLMDMDG